LCFSEFLDFLWHLNILWITRLQDMLIVPKYQITYEYHVLLRQLICFVFICQNMIVSMTYSTNVVLNKNDDVWLSHSSIMLLIIVQLNCEIPLQQKKRSSQS
jgi:hypothetical protein